MFRDCVVSPQKSRGREPECAPANCQTLMSLPTDVGAELLEFLLAQEHCGIKRTSKRIFKLIDVVSNRIKSRVVSWDLCPRVISSEQAKCEGIDFTMHQRHVFIFRKLCAACPRTTRWFVRDFSPSGEVTHRPLLFDLANSVITTANAVPLSLLVDAANFKYVRVLDLCVNLKCYELHYDDMRLLPEFTNLQDLNVSMSVSTFCYVNVFKNFLAEHAPHLHNVPRINLEVTICDWASEYSEALATWEQLYSLTLYCPGLATQVVPNVAFEKFLQITHFIPVTLTRMIFNVNVREGESCDKWLDLFNDILSVSRAFRGEIIQEVKLSCSGTDTLNLVLKLHKCIDQC